MATYFFYGTLMDADVLQAVLGRAVALDALQPATLSGYVRRTARGASYPVLLADPDGEVEGCIFSGVRPIDERRLARYEGDGYDRRRCQVRTSDGSRLEVFIFRANERVQATDQPWDLAVWQSRDKSGYLDGVRRFVQTLETLPDL